MFLTCSKTSLPVGTEALVPAAALGTASIKESAGVGTGVGAVGFGTATVGEGGLGSVAMAAALATAGATTLALLGGGGTDAFGTMQGGAGAGARCLGGGGVKVGLGLGAGTLAAALGVSNFVSGCTKGHSSGTLRVAGSGGVHAFSSFATHCFDVGRGVESKGNNSLFTTCIVLLLAVGTGGAGATDFAFLLGRMPGLSLVDISYARVSSVVDRENTAGEIDLQREKIFHMHACV